MSIDRFDCLGVVTEDDLNCEEYGCEDYYGSECPHEVSCE